jgi:hypothetical protein
MQSANYETQTTEAQILGLTNQLAYHGGIAQAGAKLLAQYILDLRNRVELLTARIEVLEADKRIAAIAPRKR